MSVASHLFLEGLRHLSALDCLGIVDKGETEQD